MGEVKKLSEHLGLHEDDFGRRDVFNPFVGIDTHLFLDPALLRTTSIPAFAGSYEKMTSYFSEVLKLLSLSKNPGDIAYREACKRLRFKEIKGVSIGYGQDSGDGNAIGPELAAKMADTASQIVKIGIRDASIFEVLSLFVEGMGADRLSDMSISIIRQDIFAYTDAIISELNLQPERVKIFKWSDKEYRLVKNPVDSRKAIVLLPKSLLRDLPMAISRDEIGYIVYFNEQLRRRLSGLIIQDAAEKIKDITKAQYREVLINEQDIPEILTTYKQTKSEPYDFDSDPGGEINWSSKGKEMAEKRPLVIENSHPKTLEEVNGIVRAIIDQFRRSIESNELYELLYKEPVSKLRPKNERFAQRLFFSVADTYCKANNVMLSREPNAGNGPVDFKVGSDYRTQVLVEIKLSSGKVRHGFEKQLPEYESNENAAYSFLVVIRVTNSIKQIEDVRGLSEVARAENKSVPELIVIDGLPRKSASQPRRIK